MKKLTKMLAAFALLVGVFGVAATKSGTVSANAVAIPANTTLYLKPNTNWLSAGAKFSSYFFDNENTYEWKVLDKVVEGIYSVSSPTHTYEKVIFTRMDPAGNQLDWTGKWNQTGDLVFDGVNNLFTVPDGAWDKSSGLSGLWSQYDSGGKTLTSTSSGIDSSKVRIWLDRNSHFESGFIHSLRLGSELFSPTGYEKALKIGEKDRDFAYYDLPISSLTTTIGVTIVDSSNNFVLKIADITYSVGDNNKVLKVDNDNVSWSLSKGPISGRVYSTFFAKVLEGYLTCSDSSVNGYMAFGSIDSNFLPRTGEPAVWNMEGTLSGQLIADYENEVAYVSGTRETTAATDAFDKYSRMQSLFIANEPESRQSYTPASTNIGVVIIISVLSLTSLAGFYFLKTKKQ